MAKPRGPLAKWLQRRVGYPLEAAFVFGVAGLFRALPLDAASALGGWIGRTVGPLLPGTRTARRNMERAFPEKPRAEIDAILRGMWDNLGRVIAEYPHLDEIGDRGPGGRMEVVGGEHIDTLREDGKAGILVSGHLANWEVLTIASRKLGMELAVVYRAPNNPYVGALLNDLRGAASGTHIPKGAEGARTLLRVLTKGGHVGLLIDQKMNDGIPVPFFGRDAMTAPAGAQLALRLGIPLVPVRTERLGGARFRITVLPPVEPPVTGDRNADVRILMERLNHLLEQWIRERPAEWLWLHRRWPN
ncbi:lipid A biosynthesis lauroyl acyltransferase [Azospirillum canadense]|uniref:lipid A biosynthesis lauroyl acyltransferase n=1 Tax=Azospirillum canadense TaxID=403962 RepID=UPI00222664C1|nr:lipid A biosynthesis lauroyl acyltransferase [Azospirillum canadense]MCW2237558.1 KDO2-lipid IV(A) lauroyltransferase [Azospirillum canadense]